jgi:hypothetical protein
MSTANLDAFDLAEALSAPGLIREDVVDTVYNLDEGIPTPLMDLAGSMETIENLYHEFTEDDLKPQELANAVVDGSDAVGNDTQVGRRVGNRAQLSDKVVNISHAAESVNTIGSVGRMAYQISRRLMDLRRSIEGTICSRQASVVDNGNNVPGRTAGLYAWIKTNTDYGVGGSAGGFDTATKLIDAPTPGNARALTWEGIRDQIENIYNKGGNPSVLTSVPGVIKRINSFLFSDAGAPYRASPQANVNGTSPTSQTAQGYISVVLSDFGISMSLVDNRLQLVYDSGDSTPVDVADVGLLDPAYFKLASLFGYRNDELAKLGHSDRRLLSTHWMTKVMREDAHGNIADISPTAAVTAGT